MKFKPSRNNILVQLPDRETATSMGLALPDVLNERGEYFPKCGVVLNIPDGEDELRIGDKIFFSYMAWTKAKQNHEDGMIFADRQITMRRDFIYFILRDGEYISMNGTCLISPLGVVEPHQIWIKADSQREIISSVEGKVFLIGENPYGIKKDDLVIFETDSNCYVEYSITGTLQPLYHMKVEEITVVLETRLNQ